MAGGWDDVNGHRRGDQAEGGADLTAPPVSAPNGPPLAPVIPLDRYRLAKSRPSDTGGPARGAAVVWGVAPGDPASADALVTDLASGDAGVSKPAASATAASGLAACDPAASKPAVSNPAASSPGAVDPAHPAPGAPAAGDWAAGTSGSRPVAGYDPVSGGPERARADVPPAAAAGRDGMSPGGAAPAGGPAPAPPDGAAADVPSGAVPGDAQGARPHSPGPARGGLNSGDQPSEPDPATGSTLRGLLDRRRLSALAVARLGAWLAGELAAWHRTEDYHGALTPAAVWLPPDGPARLLDPPNPPPDVSDPANGAYLAPEQCTGGPVGPATDVFALGVVLLAALTGPDWVEHAATEPAAAPVVPNEVPGPLADVLLAMTQLAPPDRPTAARAAARFAAVVERLAGPDPAVTEPTRQPEDAAPPGGSSRGWWSFRSRARRPW